MAAIAVLFVSLRLWPLGRTGLAAHPLVVGTATGALCGDVFTGFNVGLVLSPLADARARGRIAPSAGIGAAAGVAFAVHIDHQGILAGWLLVGFLGATVGGLIALILPEGKKTVPSLLLATLALALLLWFAPSFLQLAPGMVGDWVPWTSGALLAYGFGALIGRRPRPAEGEARALGVAVVLLAANWLGPFALLLLLPLLLLERWRPERGEHVLRVATILVVLACTYFLVWIPYQLEAWPFPRIPGTEAPVGPVTEVLGVPLLLLLGAAASWHGWLARGLLIFPILAIPLLTGL